MNEPKGEVPAHTEIGGYPLAYLTDEGHVLCAACVVVVCHEIDTPLKQCILWEGPDVHCDDCNAAMPTAYGDPEGDE